VSLYSIYVLEYGYVPEYDKSGVIYGAHNEGYIKLPYCYAVIKGTYLVRGFGRPDCPNAG
jgi:N-acyl homoserine lactone hydrolase